MAWAAPRTWVTGETVTAALLNTHVRDNFLETSAATVTTAGDISYADAANSMGSRIAIGTAGWTFVSNGTTPTWRATDGLVGDATYTAAAAWPTSFTDLSNALWGTGTTVAVSVGTGTQAMVFFGARYVDHPTLGSNVQLSYRVSGATSISSSNTWGTVTESDPAGTLISAGRGHYQNALTTGTNTFTVQALVSTGAAGVIGSPWIVVEGL
jgi:hypothetical protein